MFDKIYSVVNLIPNQQLKNSSFCQTSFNMDIKGTDFTVSIREVSILQRRELFDV